MVSARGTSLRLLQNIRAGVFLEELWDRGKLLRFHSLTLLPVLSLWFLFWKGKMWSISIKFLFLCLHDHNQVYSSKTVCKSKPFPFYLLLIRVWYTSKRKLANTMSISIPSINYQYTHHVSAVYYYLPAIIHPPVYL